MNTYSSPTLKTAYVGIEGEVYVMLPTNVPVKATLDSDETSFIVLLSIAVYSFN